MGISNDIRPTHPVHHEVPKKEPVKPKDEEDLPAKKRIRDSEPERTLEPEQIVELNQPNREPEKRDAFFDENTQEPADDTAPKDLPKWLSYLILWLIAGVLLVILIVINWNWRYVANKETLDVWNSWHFQSRQLQLVPKPIADLPVVLRDFSTRSAGRCRHSRKH